MKSTSLYWETIRPHRAYKANLSRKYNIWLERIDNRKTYEQGSRFVYRVQTRKIGETTPIRQAYLEDTKNQGIRWAQLQAALKMLEMHLAMHPGNDMDSEIIKLLQQRITNVKPKLYAPITLQQAMKISGIWNQPDESVWLIDSANDPGTPRQCMTVYEIKKRLDTKHTMIYRIEPKFIYDDYYGIQLTSRFINWPNNH